MVVSSLRSKQKVKKDQSTIQHMNNRQPPSRWYYYLGFFVLGIMLVSNFVFFQNSAASITMTKIHSSMDWNALLPLGIIGNVNRTSAVKYNNDNDQHVYTVNNTTTKTKTTVAYAITVTNFQGLTNPEPRKGIILDRAAVLHQSIKLAMNKSIRYDYDMHAFVHPEAVEVVPWLKRLGYRVHIKDTPFNITEIQNPNLIKAQNNGCCKEKEYLKLYSYLLLDYPVVVHLDLDTLVLKPMDDVFDIMTDPFYDRTKFKHHSMWKEEEGRNGSVDFVFTRDYNMVDPPKRQPHQIGTQGGFLVMKPSKEDFDKFVSVILSGGNFSIGKGWGGELRYGGYYGAGTIQGLASYYYSHLQPNRSVELNRCYYNTMVDNPYHNSEKLNRTNMCRTLELDNTCQDCRNTSLNEIYTTHLTVCGKPEWCNNPGLLCTKLLIEWHKVRTTLEREWSKKYPIHFYDPKGENITGISDETIRQYEGHCTISRRYIPMIFPNVAETDRLI